jgi:hypothetical protein
MEPQAREVNSLRSRCSVSFAVHPRATPYDGCDAFAPARDEIASRMFAPPCVLLARVYCADVCFANTRTDHSSSR